ncbi:ABC transporter ATP-binding protein [Ensifer sp. SSB1]|jgi:ABC-type branched-subunit amino acid transport system ATPase component|uniref:ABC transporter ATP-binding protein n=1 Tax=Ensifer sp. SSB1 TaxID=2795385 RepID=UPI001A56346D|nr:ABC transporter ATP-binding protein [Ensifer sp. SSB1]MBK5567090.1 ABC transporter ATP-binding protein [Ensifer sp. SSB1]
MAQKIAISCHGLSKAFGALKAVNDVHLEVPEGTILGIGGPNGAGKTTLFDVISGIQPPTSGRYFVNGLEATKLGVDRLCHMGMARTFQADAGFDTMSALENVRVATYFGTGERKRPGLVFDRVSKDRAFEALSAVGLKDYADVAVGSMPVLERKLVMLAGALAMEPRILLMDEPVGGLTPKEMATFIEVVQRLKRENITIVIIEHVMSFLLGLCERIVIMHQGSVIFSGTKHEMLSDPQVVEVYLGSTAVNHLKSQFNLKEVVV